MISACINSTILKTAILIGLVLTYLIVNTNANANPTTQHLDQLCQQSQTIIKLLTSINHANQTQKSRLITQANAKFLSDLSSSPTNLPEETKHIVNSMTKTAIQLNQLLEKNDSRQLNPHTERIVHNLAKLSEELHASNHKQYLNNKQIICLASFVTLSLALIWLLWYRRNRRIKLLSTSIEQLKTGNFHASIPKYASKNIGKLSQNLEQLRNKLQHNDKQQKHFLQHISHELKTPLASIKEGTSLLNDKVLGKLNDDQQEIIDILQQNTKDLQNSIESLLDYNTAISSKQIKRREMINLTELIEQTIEKHAIQIKRKHLVIEPTLNLVRAFVDREQMLTVFSNLLSNAIKFSHDKGKIFLSLNKHDDSIIFTISDHGFGIKAQDRDSIFDAFYIGDQQNHSSLKGTGLGLSIAKQYVEINRGTIKLVNTDIGATFKVKLKS